MPVNPRKHSTQSELIINNKNTIIYLLKFIIIIISVVFMDYYVLPASKAKDVITEYSVRTMGGKNGTKPQKVSYHYYTRNGFTFSTVKKYIEQNHIEIEYSLLFKSVIKVKSKSKNYTNILSNGLSTNGIQLYCCYTLLLSILISLRILNLKKGFTENAFYNIICFNSFMVMVCLYMSYLY